MSSELEHLHAAILTNLDALGVLTAEAEPQMARLTTVRLALTRASRARTLLLDSLYGELMARATPDRRAALQSLKDQARDNLAVSTSHISKWTLRQIEAAWPEYCLASDAMQTAMRRRVRQEAELIVPLLRDAPLSSVA